MPTSPTLQGLYFQVHTSNTTSTALFDQLMIDVHTIGKDHIGQCVLVCVLTVSLENDICPED